MEIYSNQAELKAIANHYNINVHIFTYGRPGCGPQWSLVCPDPERTIEAEFPKGAILDMHLYHEFDSHYDLLVDDAKIKTLSKEIKEPIEKSKTGWTTMKKKKQDKHTNHTEDVEEEEFLTDSEEEVLQRNKTEGFRRVSPTSEPLKTKQQSNKLNNQCIVCKVMFSSGAQLQIHMISHMNEDDAIPMNAMEEETMPDPTEAPKPKSQPKVDNTLCNICKLRCTSKKKLETHMRSHTRDVTYDMSSLQDAIQSNSSPSMPYKCTKCNEMFREKKDLRKHITALHPSHKPCKNFSTGKHCDFGAKCDYKHVIVEDGTFICWDCGNTFAEKKELMVHRKTIHGIDLICKKFLEGNCDRSDLACWYCHSTKDTTPTKVSNMDFPNLPQHKEKPKHQQLQQPKIQQLSEITTSDVATNMNLTPIQRPDKTQNMLLQLMKLIQNQNSSIMSMMEQICQGQSQ